MQPPLKLGIQELILLKGVTDDYEQQVQIVRLLLQEEALEKSSMTITLMTNQSLDESQRELLLWHHKLGHMNFDWLQALLKHKQDNPNAPKILDAKFSSIGHCCSPLCATCQLGKWKCWSTDAHCVMDVKL
jgi:GAG-pre-integrase domain